MKNLLLPALLLALSAPCALSAQDAPTPPAQAKPADTLKAVATEVSGNIKFRLTPDAKWAPLTTDTTLPVGAEVLAGPGGRAHLQMGPSVALILKPFSRVTIAQLKLEGPQDAATLRATLAKQYGRVEFDVRDAGFKNDFKIASPNGVMAVKGTGGEHDGYGGDEWVVGVPGNKTHAITYANLVAGYQAFLSANEGVSTRLPSVSAFAAMLARLEPGDNNTLFTLLANQPRGGQNNPTGLGEWQALIREVDSLGDSPAVIQALNNQPPPTYIPPSLTNGGINTYDGTTTINGGTLTVGGNPGIPAGAINSGGTLTPGPSSGTVVPSGLVPTASTLGGGTLRLH